MKVKTISEALSGNPYPGRGIILGKCHDTLGFIAYFIMGRSENSRNRVFVPEAEGIRTRAFDPSKLRDPSLIIYRPVRFFKGNVIVTNGDQTDTIHEFMQQGKSFEDALRTRAFEPDAPNYTPRISGLARFGKGEMAYNLSILKCDPLDPDHIRRFFFEYEAKTGLGHLIHTYVSDGDPLPSFEGEPVPVCVDGTLNELSDQIWGSLDPDNRVSLFVCEVPLKGGVCSTIITNKHGGVKNV